MDSPMVPRGGLGGPEHQLEGSNSNSSGISSSRGDHGDGAQGTASGQKKRKIRSECSNEQTQQLLDACLELKRRCRMRAPKWQSISRSVNGKTAVECRRRMETLTKSFCRIKKHLAVHLKQYDQLSEEEFKHLELPTRMKSTWYYQMCEIKEQPEEALEVSSCDPGSKRGVSSSPAPAAVMVGFLSIAAFFFSPLSVWFLSVICSRSKSRLGAEHGINARMNVC